MKKLLLSILVISRVLVLVSQNGVQVFYGNLHSHTSFSDGEQTPNDAYLYARDVAGLDFLAVTDHMEQISSNEYNQCRQSASNFTVNGSFVAIFGYEWGSPYYGHCNVFNQTEMPSVLTYSSWSDFRLWLEEHPDAISEFNHPGDETYFNNWYDFEYKGEKTDSSFALIEFQNIAQATAWYEFSLNKGWHLSPVWNQDNHSADWGTKNNGRAGIWAEDLSLNSLLNAIKQGKTFATMDKNASVWIESGTNSMGSTLPVYLGMPIRIKLNDDDHEGWENVELVSDNGVIVSFSSLSNIDTVLSPAVLSSKYVFVRGIQSDGDYIWSAPLYFKGNTTKTTVYSVDNKIVVYPNPVQNCLNIHHDCEPQEWIYELYSVDGRFLYSESNNFSLNHQLKIPDYLMNGAYILRVKGKSAVQSIHVQINR